MRWRSSAVWTHHPWLLFSLTSISNSGISDGIFTRCMGDVDVRLILRCYIHVLMARLSICPIQPVPILPIFNPLVMLQKPRSYWLPSHQSHTNGTSIAHSLYSLWLLRWERAWLRRNDAEERGAISQYFPGIFSESEEPRAASPIIHLLV